MYYESIEHVSRYVASAEDAARIIHERIELHDYQALCWKNNDRTFCAVADGGINSPWYEVAVIDLDRMIQIESITFGWIESLEEKIRYLKQCESTSFNMGQTQFPLDGEGMDAKTTFECGCCGSGFTSTIRKQRRFAQDAGFGICPRCQKSYY